MQSYIFFFVLLRFAKKNVLSGQYFQENTLFLLLFEEKIVILHSKRHKIRLYTQTQHNTKTSWHKQSTFSSPAA